MPKERWERQPQMDLERIPADHSLREVKHAGGLGLIQGLCKSPSCADDGQPAIGPEVLVSGTWMGTSWEMSIEAKVGCRTAYQWFCGSGLTEKASDANIIRQHRRRKFRDGNIAEQIYNEILRRCVAKGLLGGSMLSVVLTLIKAKANKHAKQRGTPEELQKVCMTELDIQADQNRKGWGKSIE